MSRYIQLLNLENHKLCYNFYVNPESCSNPEHYEHYIRYCAIPDKKMGMGVTYIFIDEDINIVLGFVTIKTSALLMKNDSDNDLGFPALEISQLAVHRDYERQRIGSDILDFVFAKISELRETIGIQYVVLCADNHAENFYVNSIYNFSKIGNLENVPRELWNDTCIPMFVKLPEIE